MWQQYRSECLSSSKKNRKKIYSLQLKWLCVCVCLPLGADNSSSSSISCRLRYQFPWFISLENWSHFCLFMIELFLRSLSLSLSLNALPSRNHAQHKIVVERNVAHRGAHSYLNATICGILSIFHYTQRALSNNSARHSAPFATFKIDSLIQRSGIKH